GSCLVEECRPEWSRVPCSRGFGRRKLEMREAQAACDGTPRRTGLRTAGTEEVQLSWYPVELLPNGSRLSCGRLARRRKAARRESVPASAQHSASPRAITARQLQALVRRPALLSPHGHDEGFTPASRTRAVSAHPFTHK